MAQEQGVFIKEYWGKNDPAVSNSPHRLRVNDPQVSLDPRWGTRPEGKANGLMLIPVRTPLFEVDAAELYLELWGGHPGTESKQVSLNGRGIYDIPDGGTADHHCSYTYPAIKLKVKDLVQGSNAFQFRCKRGKTFWGHYIVDNACVRLALKDSAETVKKAGYEGFTAKVGLKSKVLLDKIELSVFIAKKYIDSIVSVDYLARYNGYDDRGTMADSGWHGFTHKKKWKNHVGSSSSAPFRVTWTTGHIPDQKTPLAVQAIITLKGGLKYRTPVLDGLTLSKKRKSVAMHAADSLISPFWSRAGKEKQVTITIPEKEFNNIASARLQVKTWDGGAGKVKEPFTINGHPYTVISGKAVHDVVFTDTEVDPVHLQPGKNEIKLLSDTEHHGIEVLYPGPVLIIRQK